MSVQTVKGVHIMSVRWGMLSTASIGREVAAAPWLCRAGRLDLVRDGVAEPVPAAGGDPYRIEFEAASEAIETGAAPAFGRVDAVQQASVVEAVRTAAATATTVIL